MLLTVDHVRKTFPESPDAVLDDASLAVAAGEKVGVIGRSGSGKSTLARIVAGLLAADEGTVALDGAVMPFGESIGPASPGTVQPVRFGSAWARRAWLPLQMVFQNPEASFSSHMSLGRAIWEGAAYRPGAAQVPRADRRVLVADVLEAVGLPATFAAKRAFEVSGGQCQRAAIARAIIGEPKLVICDEATSSLDVTVQAKIMGLLSDLHRTRGMAFLFISHNLPLVANFCDRIYRLQGGALQELQ